MNDVTMEAPQGAPLEARPTHPPVSTPTAQEPSDIVFTGRDDEFSDLVRRGALLGEGFADSLDVTGF